MTYYLLKKIEKRKAFIRFKSRCKPQMGYPSKLLIKKMFSYFLLIKKMLAIGGGN